MKLVYFAWVRERVGKAEEEIAPPESVATVTELIGWLSNVEPAGVKKVTTAASECAGPKVIAATAAAMKTLFFRILIR